MFSPKYEIENELFLTHSLICGCDEVGRGPLAGPVVSCAIIMPSNDIIDGVSDSKKLTKRKRNLLFEQIISKAVAYNICVIGPEIIDKINILQATRLAMKGAIEGLQVAPTFVLTDGNMTIDIDIPQKFVIKGDAKCYNISCASIVAKVYRDNLMDEYAKTYPEYLFEKNAGYGTKAHIEAIKKYGVTPIHRRSFLKWDF